VRVPSRSWPARLRPGRQAGPVAAGLIVLVLSAGCATEEKTPGRAVSVPRQPRPSEATEAGAPREELDAILGEMSAAIQRGDCERALALGDQLMARKPPEDVRAQAERLRKVAKQQLLQSLYVDAVVRTEKDRVTIGERIKGDVTLINVGTEKIVIEDEAPGAPAGSSRTLLHLEVRYREFSPDGTVVAETLTSNVVVGRRITLAAGGRHSIPLELDTLGQNPSGTMLRHYDVGGSVFLAELRAGDETIYGQIQLKPRRVQVFPRNWEHLMNDPVGKLAEAIRRRSPTHVPLAAALVPQDARPQALAVLRDALRDGTADGPGPATQRACCVALSVLTGEDRKPDPEVWLRRLDELLS
jgi:hypothetical protein